MAGVLRRDTGIQGGGHVKTEDWSDAPTHQETSNIACKPPEARKRKEKIPYKLQREYGPTDTLILDF